MKKRVYIEEDERYRSPIEQSLREQINTLLKAHVPKGSRATVESIGGYVDVQLTCDGASDITCYYCCLKPAHTGKCYSSNKNIHFTPENR